MAWWWNASVENCVKEKLWSQWKKGSVNKERDLEAKRAARRTIYKAKMDAEKRRFPDIMRRDDQKNEVFKMTKQMIKTNQDIIGEECIRSDDGELATSEIQKKNAWKCYYDRFLNTEFSWDRENLGEVETVSGAAILIEKEMVREAVKKMKKGKADGPSSVVAEMVKAVGDKRYRDDR